uniref:TIR domain-containing protein n=1 Tax=Saccharothrix longispora TaxID=33920 RepID=UPI0036D2680E
MNYRQNTYSGAGGDRLRRLPHAQVVEAMAERLHRHFGADAVFMDTGLRIGAHYPAALRTHLDGSEVLIAVIHDTWLEDLRERRKRGASDWVHQEIARALKTGITVVPVLVDDATLPAVDQLPGEIANLVYPQAHRVRFGHWERDMRLLVQALENHVAPTPVPERETPRPPVPRPWWEVLAALLVGVLVPVVPTVLLVDLAEQRRSWLGAVGALGLFSLFFLACAMGVVHLSRRMLDNVEVETSTMADDLKGNAIIAGTLGSFGMIFLFTNELLDPIIRGLELALLVFIGITFGMKWVFRLRKLHDWPKRLLDLHTADIRKALHRVEKHIAEHQPLLDRHQRDLALFALDQIDETAALLEEVCSRGRLAWQRATTPFCWLHSALIGNTIGSLAGTLWAHWATPDGGPLLMLVIAAAIVVALGAAVAATEFAYRQQRWRKQVVLEFARVRSGALRARLAESSIAPSEETNDEIPADRDAPRAHRMRDDDGDRSASHLLDRGADHADNDHPGGPGGAEGRRDAVDRGEGRPDRSGLLRGGRGRLWSGT